MIYPKIIFYKYKWYISYVLNIFFIFEDGGRKMSAAGQKNAKEDKKGDKGKGGKAPAPQAEEEEDQGPPPPLEVQIAVRLHHWKTAMDSLKEEEEKNKAMAEEQQQGW